MENSLFVPIGQQDLQSIIDLNTSSMIEMDLFDEEEIPYQDATTGLNQNLMDTDPFFSFLGTAGEPAQKLENEQELQMMTVRLKEAGFETNNQNLACFQLVLALEIQLNVIQQVIFKQSTCPLLANDAGFGVSPQKPSKPAIQVVNLQLDSHDQASIQKSQKQKSKIKDEETEAETLRLVALNWQKPSQQDIDQYLNLRERVDRIKQAMSQALTYREGENHICLICDEHFENGRQLGGHMSRKHPGHSLETENKKQLQKLKSLERERRSYFRKSSKDETKAIEKKKRITKKPKHVDASSDSE